MLVDFNIVCKSDLTRKLSTFSSCNKIDISNMKLNMLNNFINIRFFNKSEKFQKFKNK